PAQQNWRGWQTVDSQLPRAPYEPFLSFGRVPLFTRHPVSIAAERICPGNAIEQIQFTLSRQTPKSTITHLILLLEELARFQVVTHQSNYLPADIKAIQRMNVESIEKRCGRRDASLFVSTRAQAAIDKLRGCGFPKIVGQRRQHHRNLLRISQIIN